MQKLNQTESTKANAKPIFFLIKNLNKFSFSPFLRIFRTLFKLSVHEKFDAFITYYFLFFTPIV